VNMGDMDTISINRLELVTIVGCNPEEQLVPQKVFATVTLGMDLSLAGQSDELSQTLDYGKLADGICQLAEGRSWKLIECMAEAIARYCGKDERVKRVSVTIEKPSALPRAASASVTVIRMRERANE